MLFRWDCKCPDLLAGEASQTFRAIEEKELKKNPKPLNP